ncbi:restriction endonuclease [Planctomicrobium sp. SH664]|uniref:restriction endonuclease n=1 Tax=Planctomicrobium sp. SH664 TaxID=3448125 RepID=UPI003F5B275A
MEFESLVSEVFRRQGYILEQIGGGQPDGGIDHRLSKAGEVVLVQCKHWHIQKVGVKIVRELLGVVTCEGVQSGIVMTSGRFTPESRQFAAKVPIRLIDGHELLEMIQKLQANPKHVRTDAHDDTATPHCPKCRMPMTLRTARKGPHAGSQFLGLSMIS